ncbi:MAG: type II toxin-antitoxin system mRNA interferase toxin, RelE/StbE family [Candidatus Terrybacteria bacterium CG10_big_fil_rev_8_21_14_0_10_41_10]|uniref:Type II toxin-antitoxin system mRNA interferase toxin, RelE/StbE family n=1 Tax=Candidatus Terrybacteria bacterium CG10_big_fil_rev_8_21_14_0_10_41_10 TaxID=1975026 RepID=A0A2M8LAW4_9BACT|nr:MAG: type II toxin-antitoxin system mRNA interferase toxin, RelE/StbE family [Candidatus Terrybacteria bacterium CG10_big_fil_rev_8_21_14_0_10_41_10]
MNIYYTSRFVKNYKKLPERIKLKAELKEAIFKINPFDQRLETHKLHGKDKEFWSYSIDNKYRIKFLLTSNDEALYLNVGLRDDVY